jgi:HD-GYP domain-containing protein (c-di-GMP phosphodiesterase class II)
MLAQNDSIETDFKQVILPVDETSIVGRSVLGKRPINIADVRRLTMPGQNPGGLQHNRTLDDRTGYRARSMLTVPMLSARGEVIGVVQLINRKRDAAKKLLRVEDFDAEVIPFDARGEQLALALAAQAGICLENAMLYEDIRKLFEGFVDASVTAIESRDPTTSGHSRRVATLTVALAEKVDRVSEGPLRDLRFTAEDLRQLEYAGVLHDFGKVGVRENVLTKAKKLYESQRQLIELRFAFIRRSIEAEANARKLDLLLKKSASVADLQAQDAEVAARIAELEDMVSLVRSANEPTVLAAPAVARIAEIAARRYVGLDGAERPFLEPDEVKALSITRGTLTELERNEIQSHVNHTISFLSTIPWGRTFRQIPRIAGAHHETMDGRGYPHGLKGDEIPVESRMLTISDIFDALTASDRPYKPAVPVPKALAILGDEVKVGRCDPALFEVFVGAEIWRAVL